MDGVLMKSRSQVSNDCVGAVDADFTGDVSSRDFAQFQHGSGLSEMRLGSRDPRPSGDSDTSVLQRHLAPSERLEDHDLIDVADMANSKDAACDLRKADAERHAIAMIGNLDHVIAIKPIGHTDCRHSIGMPLWLLRTERQTPGSNRQARTIGSPRVRAWLL